MPFYIYYDQFKLPSPLEVDRFISKGMYIGVTCELAKLPSPLEVDRFISLVFDYFSDGEVIVFPSPLEVDRVISNLQLKLCLQSLCFRPLPR